MDNCFVSIIVPVYNVQDYIFDCLDSIVKQSFKNDVECILVDDCGIDKSMQICRDFVEKYEGHIHFKIIAHSENRGLSAARNTGIGIAEGRFVLFVDSDDILKENALNDFFCTIAQYPNADIVLSNHLKIINGKENGIVQLHPQKMFVKSGDIFKYPIYEPCNITPTAWNKLVRRMWLMENKLFFEEGRASEDLIWTYSVVSCKPNVAYNLSSTYLYRQRPNSILTGILGNATKQKWMIDSLVKNCIEMSTLYKKCNIKNSSMLNYLLWSKRNVINTCFAYRMQFNYIKKVCGQLRTIKIDKDVNISNINKITSIMDYIPINIYVMLCYMTYVLLKNSKL